MTDQKPNSEKCLESPTSIEQNSTTCANSSDNNPDAFMSGGNDRQSANNAEVKTLEVQEEEASSNPKKKSTKKPKKKAEMARGSNNTGNPDSSIHLLSFDQRPLPIYCRKCLGRNIGKKGERSDAYVITCGKCGAHEVLLKADGHGVVKISDPGSEPLPQGDLQDAALKYAGEKASSILELKEEDYPKVDEQMSSRISRFAQRLQHCSRECADLYPLIITLRSLQLKKTSYVTQQMKILENEIKNRLSSLEEGIHEIESFEARFFKMSPGADIISGPDSSATAAVARKKKCSSSAGATSAEANEAASQANSTLFDPLSSAATSPPGAVSSTSVSEENNAVAGQATGGAAAANVSDSTSTASSKTKCSLWYIERVEKLNFRLEIMHSHLTQYCMIQSVLIQNKAEEAIAKAKRNETQVHDSLRDFTQGMVDQCENTTLDCFQKIATKKKDMKKKQKLLAEARLLAEHCIAIGDEEGLRKVEEMLRQINLQN